MKIKELIIIDEEIIVIRYGDESDLFDRAFQENLMTYLAARDHAFGVNWVAMFLFKKSNKEIDIFRIQCNYISFGTENTLSKYLLDELDLDVLF